MIENQRQLAFLLSRLLWPSGVVRERVCDSAARLLIDRQLNAAATDCLADWVAAQDLESVAAAALLVLLRAKALDSEWVPPSMETLSASVKKPSLLSDMLMAELYGGAIADRDLRKYYSCTAPDEFEPEPFFSTYANGFLPPIYTDWASRITGKGRTEFSRQWAYEWQHLVAATGVRQSEEPLHFLGRQQYDHYVIFDTIMSEVYRSAFLRALAWAADCSVITPDLARFLAMKTCQLDLGLWLIEPVSRPAWWPKVSAPEGQISTVPAQVWPQVESLWERQRSEFGDQALIHAAGRVYENEEVYDLEILGAFQCCRGSASPDLGDIVERYVERSYVSYHPGGMAFGGTIDRRDAASFAIALQDWLVIPAARTVHPDSIPRWDYWKQIRGIWIPVPYSDFQFSCSTDGVRVEVGGATVAVWRVWTDGLREKQRGMLVSPAAGEFLTARREVIDKLAADLGCVFCWICRLTGNFRKYDGEDWTSSAHHRTFGTTNIVLPFS
jgi:hypothetical protein